MSRGKRKQEMRSMNWIAIITYAQKAENTRWRNVHHGEGDKGSEGLLDI